MGENKHIKLLVDGKNAFPEILKCIDEAEKNIKINMFIWRADEIGMKMAKALIKAADRGVKIFISIDRYGVVLEKSEECMHSFFHENITLSEKVKILSLKLFYPSLHSKEKIKDIHMPLLRKMLSHPNIKVSRKVFKADHSKYYIFDEKILIMGGINVEDKENGKDIRGITYQDYMIKLSGKDYVKAFKEKLENYKDSLENIKFCLNIKKKDHNYFEIKNHYINLINSSEKYLTIVMAYFSPVEEITEAILNAYNRGVKVTLMIPENANFQNDSNKKTAYYLMKNTNNGINTYFSSKMLHTKMIFNEKTISFGSSNITKKAFNQLSEINFVLENGEEALREELMESVNENIRLSRKIKTYKKIPYNRFMAYLEGFLV